MRFESAHFKLSHEMTQLLDPSGVMKSETWYHFVRYKNGLYFFLPLCNCFQLLDEVPSRHIISDVGEIGIKYQNVNIM